MLHEQEIICDATAKFVWPVEGLLQGLSIFIADCHYVCCYLLIWYICSFLKFLLVIVAVLHSTLCR